MLRPYKRGRQVGREQNRVIELKYIAVIDSQLPFVLAHPLQHASRRLYDAYPDGGPNFIPCTAPN